MPIIHGPQGESTAAPEQHGQPSRKGKKAWRKNVDVSEVEQGLRALNEEIIRGGVIKEKSSSELFTIDVQGNAKSTRVTRRRAKGTLKADEILAQRSLVPAVSARKRPADRMSDGLVAPKRQRTDWVSHKELARLKRVADGHHDTTLAIREAQYDIWDDIAPSPAPETSGFLPEPQVAKVPKSMKRQPISLAANGKQLPAVRNPGGGHSYNPLYTDYEKRLIDEGAKAVEAEKARLAAEEADRKKQEAAARSAAEAEAAEARAELSEWEEDSEWEGFQSGAEDGRANSKQPRRKTQAQRNSIKRRKEEERLAKQKAALKARRLQEQNIAEIVEQVEDRQRSRALVHKPESDEASDDNDEDEGDTPLRRKQLGKFRLPQQDLALVLPDELQESLRLLKPEGNLLKDRYRSMLVRGKVESRRRIPFRKQAKRTFTEKWTHKDFVL
ncbi:P60-like protein [Ophiocordyceps camponoti-floridani]|uniref:Ribosome biogenesis protein NOP53 n=1 Tax=Ophiocordyceps camponoti-floridani TaxID=2030778 RepID=A0A8H4Q3K4_9HYPO|nr:P60-like protein [Ophiocordyceps camponoti-floridani]